ncbi:MAG: heme biosynthesis protein HemY [Gammaproteobacteria bacterium]
MSVRLLRLVTLLAIGGLAGLLISRDPGYVLVVYDRVALETGLWVALLLLALAYLALRVTLFLIARLRRGPSGLLEWRAQRRQRSADARALAALDALVRGDWRTARSGCERAAALGAGVTPLLAAALAARLAGDAVGEGALLDQAARLAPDEAAFARAVQCRDTGDWAGARAALLPLANRADPLPEAQWLLAEIALETRDWVAFDALLPALTRARARAPAELDALQVRAAVARLGAVEAPGLSALWDATPHSLRHQPAVALAWVRRVGDQAPDQAEQALVAALQQGFDEQLVLAFGTLPTRDPARSLAVAEGWLRHHPDNGALFLTMGRLAARAGRWAQAREHFEMAVRLQAGPAAEAELGRLRYAMGDPGGVELAASAAGAVIGLPLPAAAAGR